MKRLLSANKECDLLHRGTYLVMGMPRTFGREGSYHLARKKTPASYSQEVAMPAQASITCRMHSLSWEHKAASSVMQERNRDPQELGHSVDNSLCWVLSVTLVPWSISWRSPGCLVIAPLSATLPDKNSGFISSGKAWHGWKRKWF